LSRAPFAEVLKKVEATEEKARHDYETVLLQTLIEKKAAGQAVDGIQAVLEKTRDNWVDSLIIQENFFSKGVFCRKCGYLGLKPDEICPSGCGKPERTNDLVEHLIQLALRQGVDLQFVNRDLEKHGGIAALLRFPIGR
jgi:peptide subunit release factor 1 (eRF1)